MDIFKNSYCINLTERNDRYQHVKSLFCNLDIPVKIIKRDRHPNSGEQGCFESHIHIINKAYKKGLEYCVIFEDDIEVTDSFTLNNLKIIEEFIKSDVDWNLFYLGICPAYTMYKPEYYTDKILKVRSIYTHAYIISRKMMKRMLNAKYIGIPIDVVYLFSTKKSFCFENSLFNQGNFDSDISGKSIHQNFKQLWQNFTPTYIKYINLKVDSIAIILAIGFILLLLLFATNPSGNLRWFLLIIIIIIMLILVVIF